MLKRTPLLLVLVILGCGQAAPTSKPLPADEPLVDEIGADSLRAPTLRGPIQLGGQSYGDFTSGSRYHGFTLHLETGQQTRIRLGGRATDGTILDTVLYVYGPTDMRGHRARVAVSDDRRPGDLGSAIDLTAPASGEYLIVATTWFKPDPGHYALLVGCFDGPCAVPLGSDAPQPSPHFAVAPFANPELLATFDLHLGPSADPAASWPDGDVDALAALFASDAREDGSSGAVAASDSAYVSQVLFGASGLSAAQHARLERAIARYVGSPAEYARRLSPHAREITLFALNWDSIPAATPDSVAQVARELAASWPGSTLEHTEVMPMGRNGQLYGFVVDVGLAKRDAMGNVALVWDGLETFGADGTYLGDFSLPPHPAGSN